MRASGKAWILACIAGTGLLPGCGKSGTTTSGQTHQIETICFQCESRATLPLPLPAEQENWPKPCDNCRRGGRYASGTCGACSAVVPLMDPRTQGYGTPGLCPKCGKAWKPAAASAKPAR